MTLIVPFLSSIDFTNAIEELSLKADGLVKNKIAQMPWPTNDYKPDVSFAIAHCNSCILLKYYVVEKNIRVAFCNPNDPVYKDSCVEFFISFGNEKKYYNFEFNCIGTSHAGYGINRTERELLPEAVLKEIKTCSVITSLSSSFVTNTNWQLTLMIPFDAFCFHSFTSMKGLDCRVNFYKCGDDLPQPHFLTWNPIESERPDFHLPEYFGSMKFL